MTSRILVTGASGFIGRHVVAAFGKDGKMVRAAVRTSLPDLQAPGVELATLPDLAQPADWPRLLEGVDAVVHLAGVAHSGSHIEAATYDLVNHRATSALAVAAARAGVQRFVFFSSIRAQSGPVADHVLTERDEEKPTDHYGRSKLLAEAAVRASGVPYTILRPVLVYGPGVKGNMASLVRLAASPWPLPLGSFTNRRSLIGIDNLTAAIAFALQDTAALGQTFIVADPDPLTLAEIIAALRLAMGRWPGLVPVPPVLFQALLTLGGCSDVWQRLGGTLVVDPGKLLAAGWHPPVATQAGLARMVAPRSPRKAA